MVLMMQQSHFRLQTTAVLRASLTSETRVKPSGRRGKTQLDRSRNCASTVNQEVAVVVRHVARLSSKTTTFEHCQHKSANCLPKEVGCDERTKRIRPLVLFDCGSLHSRLCFCWRRGWVTTRETRCCTAIGRTTKELCLFGQW